MTNSIPRIIPCLLLSDRRLVKTTRFRSPRYIGDPINTLHIFSEHEVDEIMLLDIDASKQNREPDIEFIANLASECFVPLSYGGGVTSVEQAAAIFRAGVEKIVLNSALIKDSQLISAIADRFGRQSIVASIDIRKSIMGNCRVYTLGATKRQKPDPVELAKEAEAAGAGEIMITSVDREGSFSGYDLPLIRSICLNVRVPIIASGGAGTLRHIKDAVVDGGASAAAVGSMFVFQNSQKGVLINYPNRDDIERLFCEEKV